MGADRPETATPRRQPPVRRVDGSLVSACPSRIVLQNQRPRSAYRHRHENSPSLPAKIIASDPAQGSLVASEQEVWQGLARSANALGAASFLPGHDRPTVSVPERARRDDSAPRFSSRMTVGRESTDSRGIPVTAATTCRLPRGRPIRRSTCPGAVHGPAHNEHRPDRPKLPSRRIKRPR